MPSISTENIHLGNSKAIAQFIKSISMNNRKMGVHITDYQKNTDQLTKSLSSISIDKKKELDLQVYSCGILFTLSILKYSSSSYKVFTVLILWIVFKNKKGRSLA